MPEFDFLTDLHLEPHLTMPLYRQITAILRHAILNGQLSPGTKMPSSRWVSQQFNISRNTILNAYNQLKDEGCLVSQHGSGTYVTINLGKNNKAGAQNTFTIPKRDVLSGRALKMMSLFPRVTRTMQSFNNSGAVSAFQVGIPALDQFPRKTWQTLIVEAWRNSSIKTLIGGTYQPLCKAIASHLTTTRGILYSPSQVIVTTGSQMGIILAARVLLDPGTAAWLEDPGYPGAYGALQGASVMTIPVPLDQEGLSVEAGMRKCPQARMAFVTPSHQSPLGITMSFRRRLELLEWAQNNNAWILEDDYDSEFRYSGRPLAALQAIDMQRRVIYLGTFSKVMFPALRMGYLAVPPDLVDAFMAARQFTIQFPPLLEQAALAAFLEKGHYHRHVRRMRALYAKRKEILIQALERHAGGLLEIEPAESGMHIIAWLPHGMDDQKASRKAMAQGVIALPLSNYCFDEKLRGALVLGFAGVREDEIEVGAQRLAIALA